MLLVFALADRESDNLICAVVSHGVGNTAREHHVFNNQRVAGLAICH
jgi:hypothetical protein